MTHFRKDDQPLIQFLKQYRPIPPETTTSVEKQLMQLVAKEPVLSSRKLSIFRWLIPTAIAVAGLVTWVGWKNSYTQEQIATQPEELETFVIESWNGANEQLLDASKEADLENAWLILETSDTDSKHKTNYK